MILRTLNHFTLEEIKIVKLKVKDILLKIKEKI